MGAISKIIGTGLKKTSKKKKPKVRSSKRDKFGGKVKSTKAAPGPKAKKLGEEGEKESFTRILKTGVHSKNVKPLLKKRVKEIKKRENIIGQSRSSSPITLRKNIREFERMLTSKEYGKGHIMTKDGIETRLSANKRYLKQAEGK